MRRSCRRSRTPVSGAIGADPEVVLEGPYFDRPLYARPYAYDPDKDLFWDLDSLGLLRTYDPNAGYVRTTQANIGSSEWDGLAYLATAAAVIPLPASAWTGLSLLGALFVLGRRKKRLARVA